VAARLSESANTTVLLLEAGSSPDVFPNYKTPIQAPYLLGTQLDWGFVTPAQPSLNGRSLTYHRGRALGGSTVINGMAYGRGSKSVFDLWESLGNPGWGWDSVFPYFVKVTPSFSLSNFWNLKLTLSRALLSIHLRPVLLMKLSTAVPTHPTGLCN